jgi:glycosyltransferase involved in cell wall biosynthesis
MDDQPIVSIITPTYNYGRYIGKCIESVLSQTFNLWEMIIIDDASLDDTEYVVKKFKDKRIRYIKHPYNYGKEKLVYLHNEALAISKGKFITILEGDDYWPENRLELQIKNFKNSEAVLCHGLGIEVEGTTSRLWNYALKFPKNILENMPQGSALKVLLTGVNFLLAQSVMIKKEFLIKIGGFKQMPYLYLVDYPTWMELSLYGKFIFIPEILGFWRRHSFSITSLYQENLWLGMAKYSEYFVKEHKNEIEKLPVRLYVYVKFPGSYAYSILFKINFIEGNMKKAREYFKNAFSKKSSLPFYERIKIIFLWIISYIPWSNKIYKSYVKWRISKNVCNMWNCEKKG